MCHIRSSLLRFPNSIHFRKLIFFAEILWKMACEKADNQRPDARQTFGKLKYKHKKL